MPHFRCFATNGKADNIQLALDGCRCISYNPCMDIKAYLAEHDISQAEFARRIGCDRSNFHRIMNGPDKPTLKLAVAIERETAGVITASSWLDRQAAA